MSTTPFVQCLIAKHYFIFRKLLPDGVVSTYDAITLLSGCLDDGPDIDVSTFSTISIILYQYRVTRLLGKTSR